jgi:hypothetical protein
MAPIMWPTVWDSTWYYYYCYYCCFVCSGLYLNELVDNAFFIKYILNVARIMMVISVRRLNLKVSISGYWLVAAVAHLYSWPGETVIWFGFLVRNPSCHEVMILRDYWILRRVAYWVFFLAIISVDNYLILLFFWNYFLLQVKQRAAKPDFQEEREGWDQFHFNCYKHTSWSWYCEGYM